MNAGRELDALIAEKVMGWTWNEFTAWSPSGSRNAIQFKNDLSWLPYYSTDIAAAWEVVEKIKQRSSIVVIHITNVSDADETEVEIYDKEENMKIGRSKDHTIFASGTSTPHAICLAALKIINNN